MPVFIYDPDAFAKMTVVEGEHWKEAQQAGQFGDCSFDLFKQKWDGLFEAMKKRGSVTTETDMAKLGENISGYGIDVNGAGAIYGRGGWTRYTVRVSGEILFIRAMSPSQERTDLAIAEGFNLF